MTTENTNAAAPQPAPKPKSRALRSLGLATAAIVLLAVGGGIGACAVSRMKPQLVMASSAPVAIAKMADDSVVNVKGSVAEVYGNKFVLQDDSGRALVETGWAGEGGKLVQQGEQVSVQGRFDHGFVHAAFLVRADGKTQAVGGFGPGWGPRHGPWGHRAPMGFGPMGPHDGGPDAPPAERTKTSDRL